MKMCLWVVISVFLSCQLCLAQKYDTLYVQSFNHRMSVRAYAGMKFLSLSQEVKDGSDRDYTPNVPPIFGVGFSIRNTLVDVSFGQGFSFMSDKKNGKTKAFDLQVHSYSRKFVFDIYIQNYKGYYMDEPELILCPDLRVRQYGFHGEYVFNNKRYSYKAAYNQSEKQIRSAGSPLVGIGIYSTKISSDSSFVYREKNELRNFQFGISGGYAYTWAIKKKWYISLAVSMGLNFGSERITTFGTQRLEVYPSVLPRVAYGYNAENWSLGFSFVGNIIFPSAIEGENIAMLAMDLRMTYIRRFDFISKRKRKKVTATQSHLQNFP